MWPRLLFVLILLLSPALACNMPASGVGTPAAGVTGTPGTPNALTAVAQTVQATAGLTPSAAHSPTATFIPPDNTPTTGPSPTRGASRTSTPQPCDQAGFIQDVTIPDGTRLPPGVGFTKTWRLRNLGTCTWTSAYSLVFFGGDALSAPAVVNLKGDVAPQATVDIAVEMKAPAEAGNYVSYWKLRNARGEVFSLPENQPIYAQIVVDPNAPTLTPTQPLATPTFTVTPTPTITPTLAPGQSVTFTPPASALVYDFVANVCRAEWRTASGELECPGTTADPGYVMRLESPRLETFESARVPVLITHPETVENGVITGRYPPITVQRGHHFLATLGCLEGATACSVKYQVNFIIGSGDPSNLGQWEQTYDGSMQGIDVDLSSLAGQDVQIILAVLANGPADLDQAVWVNPRIVRR